MEEDKNILIISQTQGYLMLSLKEMFEMIRAEKDLKTLPPQEIIKAVGNFFEKRKGDRNA